MNNLSKILVIIFLYIAIPIITLAHPGNTASDGCHYCWTNCASWGYVYGTRHCHGGGSTYQAPSTPSCPSMSSYDSLSGNCKCYSGYIVQNGSCVSGNTYCQSHYAYGSTYNNYSKKCECPYGELVKNDSCISYNSYCQDTLGYGSKYNSLTDKCECMSGYEYDGSTCIYKKKTTCPTNSYLGTDDKCYCNAGYIVSGSSCVLTTTDNNNQACAKKYGLNSVWDGTKNAAGLLNCSCQIGYNWNSATTACIITTNTKPVSTNCKLDDLSSCDTNSLIALMEQLLSGQTITTTNDTSTSASYVGIPTGFQFATNLRQGVTSNDVKYLQILLNNDPETSIGNKGSETNYFGLNTQIAVIKFQKKYSSEVLDPYGISNSTGFFGSASRAKANTLLQNR